MATKGRRPPTEKTPLGYEVRVPKRGEFFSNLKRVAKKSAARPKK